MLDLEELAYRLFRDPMDSSVDVTSELDVDTVDRVPLLTFRVIGGPSINGGHGVPSAWNCELVVDLFDEDHERCRALARSVYDLVHSWNDIFAGTNIIDGLGHVSEVVDRSLFTRIFDGPVEGNTHITQMSGSFGLQLHAA